MIIWKGLLIRMTKNIGIKLVAIFVMTAVFLLPATIAKAEQTITLTNAGFEYTLPPGGEISDQIIVSNDGSDPMSRVFIYVVKAVTDEKGKETYELPEMGNRNDLTAWIKIESSDNMKIYQNKSYIDLSELDASYPIDFRIEVPESAPAGDYVAVIFFEIDNNDQAGGGEAAIGGRIGAKVRLRVEGEIIQNVRSEEIQIPFISLTNNIYYSNLLSNQGNIDVFVTPEYKILSSSGKILEEGILSMNGGIIAEEDKLLMEENGGMRIPANTEINFNNIYNPKWYEFGRRTINLTYGYYNESSKQQDYIEKEAIFWIIPWWLCLPVLILVYMIFNRIFMKNKKNLGIDKFLPWKKKTTPEEAESKISDSPQTIVDEKQENNNIEETDENNQCQGITKSGTRCKNKALPGEDFCRIHNKK